MKNNNQNDKFIQQCKQIDFSIESVNKEKNLTLLKTQLQNTKNERRVMINNKFKRSAALVAIIAVSLAASISVYGEDFARIIKTITLGDHAEYNVVEDSRIETPILIPEHLVGQLFDKDGKVLTVYPEDHVMYNAQSQKMALYFDDNNVAQIVTVEKLNKMNNSNVKTVEFTDLLEGKSYFIADVFMPSYLPKGYSFSRISYYSDSKATLRTEEGSNKYMDVYYTNGKDTIYSQVRYMDETTAFEASTRQEMQKIKINGRDAVIGENSLDIQIGNVMYMFFANENLTLDELTKMAESLQ